MFKNVLLDRKLILLTVSCVGLKLFSLNEKWVEVAYTYGIYTYLSAALRILLGWIPFSIGDLLYAGAVVFLIIQLARFLKSAFKKGIGKTITPELVAGGVKLLLVVYLVFNLLWGLNYDRQGIAHQTNLEVRNYNEQELFELTGLLQQKLNFYAAKIDSVKRSSTNTNRELFIQGVSDYAKAAETYHFLQYRYPSIKASLYGKAGKYFGYTGYFNPFTGEAQLKPNLPIFIKPFVINHEIAHGAGYAKENEANFVSYLVCKQSNDLHTRYSVYFEMFEYAYWQCLKMEDKDQTAALKAGLHKRVVYDLQEIMLYRIKNKNVIEPFISDFYDRYLKLNNQPSGKASYNEVIAWLVAYMKKNGSAAI